MGTEMTLAEILAEARRLDEAATKGPWEDCEDEDGIPVVCIPPEHEGPIAWNIRGGPGGRADCLILTHADAAFIAFACTALPRLARVAEAAVEMRKELKDYADNDDHVYEDCDVNGPAEDCTLCQTLRHIAAFDAAVRGEP